MLGSVKRASHRQKPRARPGGLGEVARSRRKAARRLGPTGAFRGYLHLDVAADTARTSGPDGGALAGQRAPVHSASASRDDVGLERRAAPRHAVLESGRDGARRRRDPGSSSDPSDQRRDFSRPRRSERGTGWLDASTSSSARSPARGAAAGARGRGRPRFSERTVALSSRPTIVAGVPRPSRHPHHAFSAICTG